MHRVLGTGSKCEEVSQANTPTICSLQSMAYKALSIAKEILATERTYLKDLEVLTVVWKPSPDCFAFLACL